MPERYRRFAACCVLALACAGSLPVPTFAATPRGNPAVAEAQILAERILRRESDDLLFDAGRLPALAAEIGQALATIRKRQPALAAIAARRRQGPATVLLGLGEGLSGALAGGVSVMPRTGNAAFDALNAKLGIRKMAVFPALRVVALEFGDRVNVDAASKAYRAIDGVDFAEPDRRLGDGPDVDAARSEGLWHVVFRRAWGDCPSGCMHAETRFFTVEGGDVRPVEPRSARRMAAFSALLARRGWK